MQKGRAYKDKGNLLCRGALSTENKLLTPPPSFSTSTSSGDGAHEFAFITSSQVLPMLTVKQSCFENHCPMQLFPKSAALTSLGACYNCRISGFTADPVRQNLYFNKVPK